MTIPCHGGAFDGHEVYAAGSWPDRELMLTRMPQGAQVVTVQRYALARTWDGRWVYVPGVPEPIDTTAFEIERAG